MTRRTDILQIRLETDGQGKVRASLAGVGDDVQHIDHAAGRATQTFGTLKTVIASLGLGLFIRQLIDASLAMQSIESSFKVATGSAEGAAREFKFVRDEADRLGLALKPAAEGLSSLEAASHGTVLQGKATHDIFVAVSEAMTALGRNSGDTQRALLAIEQMISKGTVAAEELRGQLGEVLPGAFELAARAMGVTTVQMNKMLDTGKIMTADLLPALAKALHETFGPEAEDRAHQLQAEINRLKTAVFELMAGSDMTDMSTAIRDLTQTISDPQFQEGFDTFVSGIITLAKWGGEAAAALGQFAKSAGEVAAQHMQGGNPELFNMSADTLVKKGKQVEDQLMLIHQQIRQIENQDLTHNAFSGPQYQTMLQQLKQQEAALQEQKKQIDAAYQFRQGLIDNSKTNPGGGGSGGGQVGSASLHEITSIGAQTINPGSMSPEGRKAYMQLIGLSEYGPIDQLINIPKHMQDAAKSIGDVNTQLKDTNSVAKDLGLTFSSAFEDAIVRGNSFRDVLHGILQDIERILVRKAITEPLANAIGNFDFGSLFSGGTTVTGLSGQSLGTIPAKMHFASGGSFTVGGSGGTDSQHVSFMATPGERVSVETPGQQHRGGGTTVQGPLIVVQGNADERTLAKMQQWAINEFGPMLSQATKKDTLRTLSRPTFA